MVLDLLVAIILAVPVLIARFFMVQIDAEFVEVIGFRYSIYPMEQQNSTTCSDRVLLFFHYIACPTYAIPIHVHNNLTTSRFESSKDFCIA